MIDKRKSKSPLSRVTGTTAFRVEKQEANLKPHIGNISRRMLLVRNDMTGERKGLCQLDRVMQVIGFDVKKRRSSRLILDTA